MGNTKNKILSLQIVLTLIGTFALFIQFSTPINDNVFAQQNLTTSSNNNNNNNQQPNINTQNLFTTKTMTLGNNVKNLVILIPNEGHHGPGEDKEARFIDQHFVPENAVINTGTTVAWFNGDVGHERKVDVKDTDGTSILFSTDNVKDMQLSPTYTFNKPGIYNYEAQGDPGVTMKGTITVGDISTPITNSNNTALDTVGVLMVPTQDIDTYVQDIKNGGLAIDSIHDFKDLRGGQKGTGDVQTLIVWTTDGKDLNSVISPSSQLSSTLPYS
jgi:plastocyanin